MQDCSFTFWALCYLCLKLRFSGCLSAVTLEATGKVLMYRNGNIYCYSMYFINSAQVTLLFRKEQSQTKLEWH